MFRTGRRRHDERIATLAVLSVALLVASSQTPLTAESKNRRSRAGVPVTEVTALVAPAPPPVAVPAPPPAPAPVAETPGYWVVSQDGGVFAYGAAPFKGSTGALKLNKPM